MIITIIIIINCYMEVGIMNNLEMM